MVLDPLTAFGLVGNIFQCIDFVLDLFQKADEIRKSSVGATQEYADLEKISSDLYQLSSALETHYSSTDLPNINDTAKVCRDVAKDLMAAIHQVMPKDRNKAPRRFKSFTSAIASVWSKKTIEKTKSSLEAHRQNLLIQLTVCIR
jgi:hypothetical protein